MNEPVVRARTASDGEHFPPTVNTASGTPEDENGQAG